MLYFSKFEQDDVNNVARGEIWGNSVVVEPAECIPWPKNDEEAMVTDGSSLLWCGDYTQNALL